MSRLVVIGNGPAAHRLVERLDELGYDGEITVLGAEPRPAYNRVLLPAVLDGSLDTDAVGLGEPPTGVRVRLGVTVTGIDRTRGLVHTDTGAVHPYDEVVLATGAHPRMPAAVAATDGVFPLRSTEDCDGILRTVGDAGHVTVLGAGVLGVEAALGLAARALRVALVHPHQHPMNRQLDAAGGRVLAERLSARGITSYWERRVRAYRAPRLELDDGQELDTAALVVCTGVVPAVEPARAAGLAVNRGVLVDDRLRTSDPDIRAIGDCAEHAGRTSGLLTSAWEQAEVLAELLVHPTSRTRSGPSTEIVRLKARDLDVAAFESDAPTEDAELVTLSDPARARYARLLLHDDHVTAAVLLGFDRAIATLTRLCAEGREIPADRLAFLLGTTARYTGSAEPGPDAVICRCNTVTRRALGEAFAEGARDVSALAEITRATTGCGSCTDEVRRLCRTLAANTATEQETVT